MNFKNIFNAMSPLDFMLIIIASTVMYMLATGTLVP